MRVLSVLILLACGPVVAETTVQYIANAGLLVSDGDSKILFDPLFDDDYGQYYLPPDDVREAILGGDAPFDEVSAVFVSHMHPDHFSAADILILLRQQPAMWLYGSSQVADRLKDAANDGYAEVFDRVVGLSLVRGDPAASLQLGSISIEAIRIPHSGWPGRWAELSNIAFRVTLAEGVTVLHLGDADVRDEHYALQPDHWTSRSIDAAFPPYWYFQSTAGRQILEQRLKPVRSIGVHVPKNVPIDPQDRPRGLRDVELLTTPGEIHRIGPD
jgi:L-ascorbate metabolism protein UlaG (beta-lactamase superfamily)